MQTTHTKPCRFATHCRAIGAAAIILTLFVSVQMAQAADGDLDPTFGTGGMLMTDINRSTDIANAVAIQADGKLVVVDLDVGRINTVECACGDSRRV